MKLKMIQVEQTKQASIFEDDTKNVFELRKLNREVTPRKEDTLVWWKNNEKHTIQKLQ